MVASTSRTILIREFLKLQAGHFINASEISDQQDDKNPYPCYGGNGLRGYVNRFSHEGQYVLIGRQGAHSGNIQRTNGKFYATEHAIVVTPNELCDVSWLFYTLTIMNLNQYVSAGAQPGLAVKNLEELKIAIPIYELQKDIGSTLDSFSLMLSGSATGLTVEINARKKQYEYYRDKLLTFKELESA